MVQVATPSRERVEHYQALRVKVEREVGRINGEFGRVGVPAVHYLHQSYSRSELAALYCAADVMMVTPLRDGMNLVAKEYVAARADHGGALVLSEFAGAAAELRQAFLCNPHDLDAVKDALLRAVHVEPAEARRRMRVMQRHLRTHDVGALGQVVPHRARRARDGGRVNDVRPRRAASDRRGRWTRELRAAIGRIARVPQLLVACDYDGTLAPIVDDPTHGRAAARGGRRGPRAGRAAADHRRGGLRPGAARPGRAVPAAQRGAPGRQPRLRVRRRLRRAARARAGRAAHAGCGDELREHRRGPARAYGWRASRPASRCTPAAPTRDVAAAVIEAVRTGPATWPGVHVTAGQGGHRAVGGRHPQGHRGRRSCAPSSRPARCSSSATTSPTRTRSRNLHGPDVGIKIGPGETAGATTGSADPLEAVRVLGLLLETRRHWLFGERAVPIERHSMLANGRTVALLTPDAKVTWLCHPQPGLARRSSPTCSAARPAGHFTRRARSAAAIPLGQRYRPGTMTVETRWSGPDRHRLARPATRPDDRRWSGCSSGSVPVAARVRAAARVRPGADRSCSRSATACWCSAPTSRSRCYAPGVEWEIIDDGGHDDRPRRGRPRRRRRRGRCSSCAAARTDLDRTTRCRADERQAAAEQPWRDWVGLAAAARRSRRDLVAAQRADPARAVPRADRRDPRRGDHLAARGAGRRPQLGLPLLLAARRAR